MTHTGQKTSAALFSLGWNFEICSTCDLATQMFFNFSVCCQEQNTCCRSEITQSTHTHNHDVKQLWTKIFAQRFWLALSSLEDGKLSHSRGRNVKIVYRQFLNLLVLFSLPKLVAGIFKHDSDFREMICSKSCHVCDLTSMNRARPAH